MKLCHHCGSLAPNRKRYCIACEFITVPQAQSMLRISRSTYWRYVRAGVIHPNRLSIRRQLVKRQEIDEILKRY